jgi:hypothetical protein
MGTAINGCNHGLQPLFGLVSNPIMFLHYFHPTAIATDNTVLDQRSING